MLEVQKASDQMRQKSTEYLGVLSIIRISFIHLAVSLGVIGVYTFIPAQLAIIGWDTAVIAYLLGIATLFEVFRLVIGYLGDNKPLFGSYRRNYVIIGLILQTLGLLFISQLLGSIFILAGMIFFSIGSATVATIADAYLVDRTTSEIRGKVAASVQFFRLLGFAVGGILGAILYDKLRFEGFFVFLGIISLIIGVLTLTAMRETVLERKQRDLWSFDIGFMFNKFRNRSVLLMSTFLLLFLIGVFAQDAILEPYAVHVFSFSEVNVGRLAAVWGTTTLLFIPLAIMVERKLGRMMTSLIGVTVGSFGLLIIALLGLDSTLVLNNLEQFQMLFMLGVATFGAGIGLATTPTTAVMLDICSDSGTKTLLLAYFGIISTIGRSSASFIAGIILTFNPYHVLFEFEIFLLLFSLFPLMILIKKIAI